MAGRDQEDALEDAGRVELENQAALDQTLHGHGGGGVASASACRDSSLKRTTGTPCSSSGM